MSSSSPYRFGRCGMALVMLSLPVSLPALAISRAVYSGAIAAFETIVDELAAVPAAVRFIFSRPRQ